jgi:YidC/Oxa1 family membrane protein insertase
MNDIRRTVLWVVFASSLLFLWDGWNKYNGKPSLFAPAPASTVAAHGASSAASTPATLPAPGALPVPGAAAQPAVAHAAPAPDATVTVTTDVFRATIDTRGGSLVRVELLKVAGDIDPSHPLVLLDDTANRTYLAQTGLVAGGAPVPDHTTPMTLVPGPLSLAPGADSLSVTLQSADVGGVKLIKTYTFHRDQYAVDVKQQVVNDGSAPVSPQLYLRLVRDSHALPKSPGFTSAFVGPAVYSDEGKFQKLGFEDIDKGKLDYQKHANDGWIAMVQHYFASAWVVTTDQPRDFSVEKLQGGAEPLYAATMLLPLGPIAPGASKTEDATLYAGPAEESRLQAVTPSLNLVRDYGRLKVLGEPLFWLLAKLHALIGNWGWAIVALVVLLKAAFYWFNASAYRSMAKMKAINPKVTALRERLKDKPQQLQQEMMRIYREEKVNPLGGCLPILVQMPFFIALYSVLLSSVEVRGTSWFWISDLSRPDALFGTLPLLHLPVGPLPLLMLASSMFQTWLNPTPPDPVQAKMMWVMPLVFSFMFFNFPAGMVLYWLTNNLLSIAQQWTINKQLGVAQHVPTTTPSGNKKP